VETVRGTHFVSEWREEFSTTARPHRSPLS
jgi:hypothetical protein